MATTAEKITYGILTSASTHHMRLSQLTSATVYRRKQTNGAPLSTNITRLSSDSGQLSILILLDLAAGFHTINHTILLPSLDITSIAKPHRYSAPPPAFLCPRVSPRVLCSIPFCSSSACFPSVKSYSTSSSASSSRFPLNHHPDCNTLHLPHWKEIADAS